MHACSPHPLSPLPSGMQLPLPKSLPQPCSSTSRQADALLYNLIYWPCLLLIQPVSEEPLTDQLRQLACICKTIFNVGIWTEGTIIRWMCSRQRCWYEQGQGAYLPQWSWPWLPLQLSPCRHPWGADSEVSRQALLHASMDVMQAAAATLELAPDPRPDETVLSSHGHFTVCSGAAARVNVARLTLSQ